MTETISRRALFTGLACAVAAAALPIWECARIEQRFNPETSQVVWVEWRPVEEA